MTEPAAVLPGSAGDLSALVRLETASMGADAWGEAALAGELAGIPGIRTVLVVAEPGRGVVLDGGPAAYGVLRAVGDTADVQRLVVAPAYRRQGLGGALLRALLHEATDGGCTRVLLEVATDNSAARALYAAYGFAEIARRRGYYSVRRDALVLECPLSPHRPYGERRA